MTTLPRPASYRDQAAAWTVAVHDDVSAYLGGLDAGGVFTEHRWQRAGGGGGVTRVRTDGSLFEKAATGCCAIDALLTPAAAARLGARIRDVRRLHYFATEFWLMVHPQSPLIPTVQLSLCYVELSDQAETVDAWFGGGADLIPTYPLPEDVALFHRALRNVCRQHQEALYPQLKSDCDVRRTNVAGSGAYPGAGGLYFQTLRAGDFGLDRKGLHRLLDVIARVLPRAYGPIIDRRRNLPFRDEDRRLQLAQRGRLAELSLFDDSSRRDDPLAAVARERRQFCLPPVAAWGGSVVPAPGSTAEQLQRMLEPRDWATER